MTTRGIITKKVEYSPNQAKVISKDNFSATAIEVNDADDYTYKILTEINLSEYDFDDNAELGIEVISGDFLHYETIGTVDNHADPTRSFHFDNEPTSLRVRLTVTPHGKNYFIGYSQLRVCYEGNNESLILVRESDLGEVTWLFEPSAEETPILFLNTKRYGDLHNLIKNDSVWQGQILPQCLYQGYMHIARNDFENTSKNDEGNWEYNWWLKAEELAPNETAEVKEKNDAGHQVWAKKISKNFCKDQKYFTKFIEKIIDN